LFRIAKHLVNEASPAAIPLITVHLAEKAQLLPKTKTPAPNQGTLSSAQSMPDDVVLLNILDLPANAVQQAPKDNAAQLFNAAQEAENLLKDAEKKIVAKLQAAEANAQAIAQTAEQAGAELLKKAEQQAAQLLQNAKQEAAAKLKAAEQERARIAAETESKKEAIISDARQEGHQDGYQEGLHQGLDIYQQQTIAASRQLGELIQELAAARTVFFDSFESDMLELALAIARKITLSTIHTDDKAFKAMINNALKQLWKEGKISLRVSEQQYQDFFNSESSHFVLDGDSIHINIINDPLLDDGDLILESAEKTIDAGVSSQLKRIELAFSRRGRVT